MERLTERELSKNGLVVYAKCKEENCVHCPSCDTQDEA